MSKAPIQVIITINRRSDLHRRNAQLEHDNRDLRSLVDNQRTNIDRINRQLRSAYVQLAEARLAAKRWWRR